MAKHTTLLLAIAALSTALILAACGDDDDDDLHLSSDHPGWTNPGCWGSDCHEKSETHNSDMSPYQCVQCHGLNGDPGGHGGSTPCGECHTNPHGNSGFPDPESCLTCHDT